MHEGRRVHASPDDLNRWLVDESAGEPVQIATETADLTSELNRGFLQQCDPHLLPSDLNSGKEQTR